jgi:hypothetical protein
MTHQLSKIRVVNKGQGSREDLGHIPRLPKPSSTQDIFRQDDITVGEKEKKQHFLSSF